MTENARHETPDVAELRRLAEAVREYAELDPDGTDPHDLANERLAAILALGGEWASVLGLLDRLAHMTEARAEVERLAVMDDKERAIRDLHRKVGDEECGAQSAGSLPCNTVTTKGMERRHPYHCTLPKGHDGKHRDSLHCYAYERFTETSVARYAPRDLTICESCQTAWPCATIQLLDSRPERDALAADADKWQRAALTLQGDRDNARAEVERLAGQIEAVRALHPRVPYLVQVGEDEDGAPIHGESGVYYCERCQPDEDGGFWPCDDMAALEGVEREQDPFEDIEP